MHYKLEEKNMASLTCFKSFGIHGLIDEDIDEFMAFRTGFAMATHLKANNIVVGGDNRLSAPAFQRSVIHGLRSAGCNVIDLGLCGTEEVYFATAYNQCDGGIMITGGIDDQESIGMKLVGPQSCPITDANGLLDIKQLVDLYEPNLKPNFGDVVCQNFMTPYIEHLQTFVSLDSIKPLKIVVNAGNGTAGLIINAIEASFTEKRIAVQFIKLNNQPDGDFPLGVPNPALAEQQKATQEAVVAYHADLAIAWDADFEQCYLFDAQGNYIEKDNIVSLITPSLSQKNTEQKTCEYHFSDFFLASSGMLPWMMVIELMSIRGQSLNQLVCQKMETYSSLADINCEVYNTDFVFDVVENTLSQYAIKIQHDDGLSMMFTDWCFTLRWSNTQSLIQLNVHSRGNPQLMKAQTRYLLGLINQLPVAV